MLRVSKLADYGTVIMAYLARFPGQPKSASEVAQDTHVPLPMTSKILKQLAQQQLLQSHRGVQGGYSLALTSENISLADIIRALEGDIALTECSQALSQCALELYCTMRSNWSMLNQTLQQLLGNISLALLTDTQLTQQKLTQQLQQILATNTEAEEQES